MALDPNKWEPGRAQQPAPRIPAPTPHAVNPLIRATLPAEFQLQPDLVPQKYPLGSIPTIRLTPSMPSANPGINAAAQGVAATVVAESFDSNTAQLQLPSIFLVAGGKPITNNGQNIVVTLRNAVQVTVDFGYQSGEEGDLARVTVTNQPWVTATSKIICSAAAESTPDHSPDDTIVEGVVAYAENLVTGVGFDIVAKSCGDSGSTWGKYLINAIGQ